MLNRFNDWLMQHLRDDANAPGESWHNRKKDGASSAASCAGERRRLSSKFLRSLVVYIMCRRSTYSELTNAKPYISELPVRHSGIRGDAALLCRSLETPACAVGERDCADVVLLARAVARRCSDCGVMLRWMADIWYHSLLEYMRSSECDQMRLQAPFSVPSFPSAGPNCTSLKPRLHYATGCIPTGLVYYGCTTGCIM
jgi:hypothetical protein